MQLSFRILTLVSLFKICLSMRQNHVIHWNTSNPIFRIDNTDHILDVNHGNQPWEYDQVNIICPNYKTLRGTSSDTEDEEKYIIYNVSKEEYETCRILNPNPRIVAVCDKPHELLYFTISFRSFTPTPGGMEFKPGKDYYFISTSSPNDLKSKNGGRCSTHNMKIAFKVASRDHERSSSSPIESLSNKKNVYPLSINTPRRRRPFTTRMPPTRILDNRFGKILPPIYEEAQFRHPNDVVKHEASRMEVITDSHPDPLSGSNKPYFFSPLGMVLVIGLHLSLSS
ncbi:ephrin-B1-like [Lepeophtheirus salmonis]|uniref:ephrin-B1-like n=1 Tax=Lepeophtheirus salmonis TaxID=72036 RepID=UPI001AE1FA6E|nr:ephrin-B1-like [Lepeophtheirus salmonis]XP_040580029.1 ephrin-B1-like [Lepeophtheirus salmonis]